MISFAQFKDNLADNLAVIHQRINAFVSFVINKLKNFKRLTLGEQIAYAGVGVGLLLVLAAMVLFII